MEMLLIVVPDIAALANILLYVLAVGIFLAALFWVIRTFFPEPIAKYAVGVVVVVAAIIILYLLAGRV